PVGAAAGGLALTVLGFLHLPFAVSLSVVLAAGAVGSLVVRRRLGPVQVGQWFWPAWLSIGLVALTLMPAFRVGITTTLGENPDAHLVTGAAEVVRAGPLNSIQPQLPVDRVSSFWQSKYPIYYSLAGASTLSGLDPIRVFPVLSGVLLALFAVCIFLLAFHALAAGPIRS